MGQILNKRLKRQGKLNIVDNLSRKNCDSLACGEVNVGYLCNEKNLTCKNKAEVNRQTAFCTELMENN